MPVHSFLISAGPNVLAGFTDEPLNGTAAKCTARSVSGIAICALPP